MYDDGFESERSFRMIYRAGALSNHPGDLLGMLTIGEDGALKDSRYELSCMRMELSS